MKRLGIILAVLAVLVVAAVWYWGWPDAFSKKPGQPDGWVRYRNAEYGFSIAYPPGLTPQFRFDQYYHLSGAWRADFSEPGNGIALVSIPVIKMRNENHYPRYFTAEVRVGVSADERDVVNCLVAPFGSSLGKEDFSGTQFSVFPIESAGMMQYSSGRSYRIVRDGKCFAIEALKVGASYRDEPAAADIADETLDSYYQEALSIAKTFVFDR